MARHKKRWGGKLGGNHQTVIEAAWRLLPEIIRSDSITKISPGFITAGKNSTGRNSLKIIDDRGSILLSLRGSSAHQEIRVFGGDLKLAKEVIAKAAENAEFHVSFGSKL